MPATSTYGYRVQASTSFEATFQAGAAYTGLVGTVGVAIYDGVGGTALARRTTGIVEATVGSGTYTATLTSPASNGQYVVEFDTGGATPQYAADDLTVAAEASLADAGTAGPTETVVLDPTSEDASNIEVSLTAPSSGINLISQDYPQPDRDRLFAGSADTFGDPLVQSRYRDRTITLVVRCYGGEASMRARVRDLTKKAGKFAQYGGTLKRTLNDATTIVFDVLDCDIQVPADWMFLHSNSVNVTLTMLAQPAGRGATTTYSLRSETTNPELIFTETAPAGDIPALGRLIIDDASGQDQMFVQWGLQGASYPGTATASTTAALSYAGTSRLAYNGATALAISGALSGTALNQGALTTSYAAMISTASAGTVHCTHVGNYNVFGRFYIPTTNAGTVSLALEWGVGDFRGFTRNTVVTVDTTWEGTWRHVDLGQVSLPTAITGSQRWEGRVIAKSTTVNDDLAVDRLYLFPHADGYGEARALSRSQTPTVFSARDEFDQAAGALSAKTLPVGGAWVTSGDATDLAVVAGTTKAVQRSVTTDGASGRFAIAGTTTFTNCQATLDFSWLPTLDPVSATAWQSAVILRYVDASNYMYVHANPYGATISLTAGVVIAGVDTMLVDTALTDGARWANSQAHALSASADTTGRYTAFLDGQLIAQGWSSTLGTGGALASGKAGFADAGHQTCTRTYDNFAAWVPVPDAAMFANQSLRVQHNAAVREDSTGAFWQSPSSYRGDYLRVPSANTAGTVRFIVKALRNDPDTMADAAIDDISATLTVTPLYLQVP